MFRREAFVPTTHSCTVAGFDGCPNGWLGAIWNGPGHSPDAIYSASLRDAETELPRDTRAVAVDIPLGLLTAAVPGGRSCDRQARKLLGPRSSSVFSPPSMAALAATDYTEACRISRQSGPDAGGISKQSFAIFRKLIDAEQAVAISDWLRERIIEVHPELCFRMIAGSPVQSAKKRAAGKEARRSLLQQSGFKNLQAFERAAHLLGAAADDALDACVAAWSAWRRAGGTARYLPADAIGPDFSMRIWY
jgi:predicted RNase H-like nuclease